MYPSAGNPQVIFFHYFQAVCLGSSSRGLTHHRHLCPKRQDLSASCSKVCAGNTHKEGESFLELRDLLLGELVRLCYSNGQCSAYLCAWPGGETSKRGVRGKGEVQHTMLVATAARRDLQIRVGVVFGFFFRRQM